MVTSVRQLCVDSGYPITDTIYAGSPIEMMDFQMVCGDFFTWKAIEDGRKALVYKDTPFVTDFATICRELPQLETVNYKLRDGMPYFSANLDRMAKGINEGRKIGVEGGPCLFGTDEVTVEIVHSDGHKKYFDFNTGKTYLEGMLADGMDLADYVALNKDHITALHFEMKKPALTPQEWAFIKYPFEIARALSACLVIPLPDMSYAKYLESVLRWIPEKVRIAAMEEFRYVSHAISDLYLGVIDKMRILYNSIPCEVVHERDEDLCRRYYEARTPYIERNRVIRKLTKYEERVEPVKDYVSMPALPYYLFGAQNCIEIDSMDETDSYRKCVFAHKSEDVEISCILYPELLSMDKKHTIFEAPSAMKEYGKYEIG